MNKKYLHPFVLLMLCALLSSHYCSTLGTTNFQANSNPSTVVEHVVVLVIDGPRYTETYGEENKKYIPYLRDSLVPKGVFFDRFYNRGVTLTVSGHAAITAGRYQNLRNGGEELPKYPGIFHSYLDVAGNSNSDAWIISSKGKLEVLGKYRDKDWDGQNQPKSYCGIDGKGIGYSQDYLTMRKVEQVITDFSPKLMLINLLDVDVAGHAVDWERYISAIQYTDSCALVVWNSIQDNPKMKGKTALFITNDHGRHKNGHKSGFANHGDMCDGCRHISLLALGPNFTAGKIVHDKHELTDIAPTIAKMLNFEMEKIKGCDLSDVLFDK